MAEILPLSFFEQALLQLFLALDAVAGPGDRFEALGVDLFAAVNTLAEAAFANARQGSIDHHEQLTVVVALAEQKFFVVGTGGAVRDVGCGGVLVCSAAVDLVAVHGAAQFLLPRFQTLLEGFQLLLIHKSLLSTVPENSETAYQSLRRPVAEASLVIRPNGNDKREN